MPPWNGGSSASVRRAVRARAAPRARRARPGRSARPGGGVPSNSTARPRATSVSAGSRPRNENRPQRSACSTDSSRKPGGSCSPAPTSFTNAETGVSRSASTSRHTGTTVWSRASATNSSRDGRTDGRPRLRRGREWRRRRRRGRSSCARRCGTRPAPPARRRRAARRRRSRSAPRARTGGRPTSRPCTSTPGGSGSRTRCARSSSVRRSASSFIQPSISTSSGALLLDDRGDEAVGVVLHRRELLGGRRDRRGDGRAWPIERGRGAPSRDPAYSALSSDFCQNPAVIDRIPRAEPHRRRARASGRAARARRRARRPLVLAARARRPRGARVPRSRERVHRGGARAPRAAARARSSTRSSAGCRRPTRRRRCGAAPCEYFTRTVEGQQYDVHCRRPAGDAGPPRSRRRARDARRASGRARRERARRRPRLLRASATSR